jgi:hypothetical protein
MEEETLVSWCERVRVQDELIVPAAFASLVTRYDFRMWLVDT